MKSYAATNYVDFNLNRGGFGIKTIIPLKINY